MGITKLKDHNVNYRNSYFFDANIWLFIYGTIGNYQVKKKQEKYSNLFSEIGNRDSIIYINSMVLSEIANVLLRKEFNICKDKINNPNLHFKREFPKTEEYKFAIENNKIILESILNNNFVEKKSDDFNALDFNVIIESYGENDFNDTYLSEFCILNNYFFVSDDGDFENSKANVLK
jgi:predicted nucleic acid-binding protein